MKLITAAAVAILLSAGMAFAQDNTTTGSTSGADSDPSNYLAGPNIHRFYQDDSMTELKSESELKAAWDAMTDQDRSDLKQACMGNKDNRYNPLCNSIKAM